jgi:glycosyltransferase involved in cell wall biosynthesis
MRIGIALHRFYDPAYVGGVQTYVHSLLKSLLVLGTGDHYLVLVREQAARHLDHLVGSWTMDRSPVEVVVPPVDAAATHPLSQAASMRAFLDGLLLDVIHFPIHWMAPPGVDIPSVLSAHDIQHVHFPEHFGADELAWRERSTTESCRCATGIVTQSRFIKDDLIRHLHVRAEKVHVVPVAADEIFRASVPQRTLDEVRRTYRLPDRFLYYPAQLWPHKNHVRLIRALARLRREHRLEIPLVLTGSEQPGSDAIGREAEKLGVSKQVVPLGAIPFGRLPALYALAHGVVVPSTYEASSFPVLEAFAIGRPVIASNLPPLRELIADDALLFDPTDEAGMARTIRRLWVDADFYEAATRYAVSQRGRGSWEQVAAQMTDLYRQVARTARGSADDVRGLRQALRAREDTIEELRTRLAETERALQESERDRRAKERVIRELKVAADERLQLILDLDRALKGHRGA